MGFGLDLNAMKLEAAQASLQEKRAILGYMRRYTNAVYGNLGMETDGETVTEAPNDVLDAASRDALISPQSFVALCVWAFA